MPEEKQRKSIRTAELDKMINKLRSLDRVDGTPSITRTMRSHTCRIWQIIWIG